MSQVISELSLALGDSVISQKEEILESHSKDMADYANRPLCVATPSTEEEIVALLKVANRHKVPVVAWGAGTSLTGAVVLKNGIVVDMSKFNHIKKIDEVNWYVHAEACVVLDDLNQELEKHGFFFPPDPASSAWCTVGGTISEGSGGMRCVKYGTMKDWVYAIRVVLPTGEAVTLGEPLPKNRAGYDLVHLFTGSEGTLGIITEAWLKIIPRRKTKIHRVLVFFDSWADAGKAIQDLRNQGIMTTLLEFMDREAIASVKNVEDLHLPDAEAMLLVDVDEGDIGSLPIEDVLSIFKQNNAKQVQLAQNEEEADQFYRARVYAYFGVKSGAPSFMTEDVVVPIDKLTEYLALLQKVAKAHNIRMTVFGHAGDGNVHPNILFDKDKPGEAKAAQEAWSEICEYAIRVGGSITGEHGVGVQKMGFLERQLSAHNGEGVLELMRQIKKILDPNWIMNPGKYIDVKKETASK
jgi:glycolate oxidase subunit GlcD